jgi:hypothetical protein
MPQKILCTTCNTILYEGFELESPFEILVGENGVCPSCGKKLKFIPDAIRISSLKKASPERE